MRKHFFIPRYDTDNNIPTRNEPSEDDDGYNSFSNHPTDKKQWSRDMLVGKDHPLRRNGGGEKGFDG